MLLKCITSIVIALLAVGLGVYLSMDAEDTVELYLMRFFRDVSRYKARSALFKSENALVAFTKLVTGHEDVLTVDESDKGVEMTAEELRQYTGEDGGPVYLAIKGRIYDVSKGREYYGPGRSYAHFAGRDATRSFCTGCSKPECLISSLSGLSPALKKEADRWLELYEFHNKYTFIGTLVEDPIDKVLEKALLQEEMLLTSKKEQRTPMDLKERGVERYLADDYEDAKVYWLGALVQIGEAKPSEGFTAHESLRAEILNLLAALAQKTNQMDNAILHYQEAIDILQSIFNKEEQATSKLLANILSDQATAFFRSGGSKNDVAIQGFLRAKAIYENSHLGYDEKPLHGNTMLNLAMAYTLDDQDDEARKVLEELVLFYDEDPDGRLVTLVRSAKSGIEELSQ